MDGNGPERGAEGLTDARRLQRRPRPSAQFVAASPDRVRIPRLARISESMQPPFTADELARMTGVNEMTLLTIWSMVPKLRSSGVPLEERSERVADEVVTEIARIVGTFDEPVRARFTEEPLRQLGSTAYALLMQLAARHASLAVRVPADLGEALPYGKKLFDDLLREDLVPKRVRENPTACITWCAALWMELASEPLRRGE
jgi:hypothetical protein